MIQHQISVDSNSWLWINIDSMLILTLLAYRGNGKLLWIILQQITAQTSVTSFLACLDEVQEELLYYPWHRHWLWRWLRRRRWQNVKVFTFKFFMWWARHCQASYPVPVTDLVICLVTSVFISITLDGVTSFSCIKSLGDTCKYLYYSQVYGGISFRVMAENWKHLKDTVAFSSFLAC